MSTWTQRLRRLLPRPVAASQDGPAIDPGLYPFQRDIGGHDARLHLRVEPDGSGLLIVQAAAAVRLTSSGTLVAASWLKGDDESTTIQRVVDHHGGATADHVRADLEVLRSLVTDLLSGGGSRFFLTGMGDASLDTRSGRFGAPVQAHLELADPVVSQRIVRRLWDIGIPMVVLRDADGVDRGGLVATVELAEDLGMITVVRSWPARLRDGDLLRRLAEAGLDALVLPLVSTRAERHDAVWGDGDTVAMRMMADQARQAEVPVVAEVPLLDDAFDVIDELPGLVADADLAGLSLWPVVDPTATATSSLESLSSDDAVLDSLITEAPGETTVSTSVGDEPRPLPGPQIIPLAAALEELVDGLSIPSTIEPAVRIEHRRTVHDLMRHGPRCGGDLSILVTASGSVIPPRGPFTAVGHLLDDRWDDVWHAEAFAVLREAVAESARCDRCVDLEQCRAWCPADAEGWAVARTEESR